MFSYKINKLDEKSSSDAPAVDNTSASHQQLIKDQLKSTVLADADYPLQRKTSWPKDRHRTRYLQLHYPKLPQNLDDPALQLNLDNFPANAIIVDAGAGDGLALAQMKTMDNMTVGFSLHKVKKRNQPNIDVMCYSPIPHGSQARAAFAALHGRVDRVFDTYGPGTYGSIHSLIYCGMLLSPNATAHIIISSVLHEHPDQSPIGYAGTRKRLIELFRDAFQLEMTIARTFIRSAVQAGATCKDFNVTIKRPLHAQPPADSLDNQCAILDAVLGKPVSIPKTTNWGNFEDGFKIEGKAFLQHGETNLQAHDWQSAISAVHMDYVIQHSMGIRFYFQFDDQISCSQFSIQFSEFFVSHPHTDWQIMLNAADACTITYYDTVSPYIASIAVSKAVEQLSQAELKLPDYESAEAIKFDLEKTAIVIFNRGKAHQPLLFKIPETRYEPDPGQNQNKLVRE